MIQRIQSLYLLVAAALVITFLSLGNVWAVGLEEAFPWVSPVVLVVGGLTVLVTLGAVFLYKDRARQRTVIAAAQWLDLALVLVLVGVLVALAFGEGAPVPPSAVVTALLPFGAYVFLRLARRGVEKDIALVRSMDRLR